MRNWFIIFLLILGSCTPQLVNDENRKKKLFRLKRILALMAKEKGNAAAFYAFADDSAVIRRGPQIIKGKEAIKKILCRSKRR